MKLIIGLGNPGFAYKGTRHNIGFFILESLAGSLKIALKKDNTVFSYVGKAESGGQLIVLAEPFTFMNLSGRSVKALVKKFNADIKDILIICDDLDLELGRIKIRPGGASGGHNGLASIIEQLGTKDFCRLRVGIGRPVKKIDPADYVLSKFLKNEKIALGEVNEKSVNCCISWIENGITETMNMFNIRSRDEQI